MTATPNGWCFCDCGGKTKRGSFFLQGHDKRADRYLEAIDGSQSIADKLAVRDFVPAQGKSLRDAALEADKSLEECGRETLEGLNCRVIGRGVGMRRHRADDSQHKY